MPRARTLDPALAAPVSVLRSNIEHALPLVCDSPHSGTYYPAAFRPMVSMQRLRQAEDTHVDALWSAAPDVGATLIAARFARTYVDVNRDVDDLDPRALDGPWPTPLRPGEKSRLGFGLVWTRLDASTALYEQPLAVADVQQRIARCWHPYRRQLQRAIDGAVAGFGVVWHLNLHSMPADAHARLGRRADAPLADIVLGDREGRSCEPELVEVLERCLGGFGYRIARNDPYRGAALVARFGAPAQRRHSLQIELRRSLYMDERTRQPHGGFKVLQQQLTATLHCLATYVRGRLR